MAAEVPVGWVRARPPRARRWHLVPTYQVVSGLRRTACGLTLHEWTHPEGEVTQPDCRRCPERLGADAQADGLVEEAINAVFESRR
ncbi:MAG: hypothetical protein AAGA48_28610 [Myxococcota bacterium]